MDVDGFLEAVKADREYAGQIVHTHEEPARAAVYADPAVTLAEPIARALAAQGIERLYTHQARAIAAMRARRDILVTTGTASGKTLCYALPLLETLLENPDARCLLIYPSKALCQDQFRHVSELLTSAGLTGVLAGVYDGDTPSPMRRRLRDGGHLIFTNPDMLHAGILPAHGRWSQFLGHLDSVVIDEFHVYSGMLGTNMALLMRRFLRVCGHYGAAPRIAACSATLADPAVHYRAVMERECEVIEQDGSPRGRRVTVFWNAPRIRPGHWRSRRSANVEAHELMARLIADGIPTITFSKAKMTAEMIHRYVRDKLRDIAPQQMSKVTPYRGGYLPSERRELERRLFAGELLGVSATRALELGIDVGALEASIIVGYPGTRASFFQQSGRAGRRDRDAVVFLVGVDTAINQYIMTHPEYIFDRSIERAVIDSENPFAVGAHLRCAAHELPLPDAEVAAFGRYAGLAIDVLAANHKVSRRDGRWYYAVNETPQHDVSLRDSVGANVLIHNEATGEVIGEVDRYDAPPLLHPQAIYMHLGETFIVTSLDLERNLAMVRPIEVDYYTQPLGGTDIHHVDHQLRDKPFGEGHLYWGEVTAYFNTHAFEKVHFYSLDAISVHGLELPTMALDTMAFWLVPDEAILNEVRAKGLDVHSGLRGIGYSIRMLLPFFMTCDTLDFSHTIGSVNSAWQAVFVYERFPHGLGYTQKAYQRMHEIVPAVYEQIQRCPCHEGCPCCVGKPLRGHTTWNIERGEASIPSKAAALLILKRLLGDDPAKLQQFDAEQIAAEEAGDEIRLRRALRRHLETGGQPQIFHPIKPRPEVQTEVPDPEKESQHKLADSTKRQGRHRSFEREFHKRLAKRMDLGGLEPLAGWPPPPRGMRTGRGDLRPTAFEGRPEPVEEAKPAPIVAGDSLASKARRLRRGKKRTTNEHE